jgi:hypothetical protein
MVAECEELASILSRKGGRMFGFGLKVSSVPEVHHNVEDCLRSSPELKDKRDTIGLGRSECVLEDLDEAIGDAKMSDMVKADNARSNKEILIN